MSVEDVEFMKKHSLKQNYTFIVDSRFRNKEEYPEPNFYQIVFDQPFKNVFGIEILDVTIPKTMYNVDIDANKLILYINTTKNPIDNYETMAAGLIWKNYGLEEPENNIEIINYRLADRLKTNNVSGLEWIIDNNINLSESIEITNNLLESKLKINSILTNQDLIDIGIEKFKNNNYIVIDNNIYKPKNNFSFDEWINFNITNLSINNYIKVVNPLKWIITHNITNNSIKIFNIKLSNDLININTFSSIDQYDIHNLRSYNIIPILDLSLKSYLNWYYIGDNIDSTNNLNILIWENIGEKKIKNGNEIFNDKLKHNLSNNKFKFTEEDIIEFNLTNIKNNTFIFDNNYYYKPKSNLNIGSEWINIGYEKPSIGNEYLNQNISQNIFDKFDFNNIIEFTNYELNLLDFTFDINYNDYIRVPIGQRWISVGINPANISDGNTPIYSLDESNFKNVDKFNFFKNKILTAISSSDNIDIYDFSNEDYISLGIKNLNFTSYIIIGNLHWIPAPLYYKPDGIWLNNFILANKLNDLYNNEYGLNWKYIGNIKPEFGNEIFNSTLKSYLNITNNILLTTEQFNSLNLENNTFSFNDFILGNDNISYYTLNSFNIDENYWNTDINIDINNLNIENFVSFDNKFFKIVPSYYYSPQILFYKPDDHININNVEDYNTLLDLFFEKFEIILPIGNYNINKLILAINNEFAKINQLIKNRDFFNNRFIDKNDNFELLLKCQGNSNPADLTNILKFESKRKLIFNMNLSTCDETLGFYSIVSNDIKFLNDYYFKRLNINNNKNFNKFYHSIYNYEFNKENIIAPGIIYLIGSKYIILKCPEIEEHLYGSLSYSRNTIGLAKIRTSHWGLNEENNSFYNLKLREFHPIGKLSKITLKFENADGSLYDFRGVNHDIVFAIHYYSPRQQFTIENSIANPEYKMNFIDYKYSASDIEDSDSSDNDNNYSNIDSNKYKYYENKYKNLNNGYEM